MHTSIALLTCFVVLLTGGRTKNQEGFQCQQNVPEIAKNALLDAIKEERKNLSLGTDIEYDEGLAKKARKGVSKGTLSAWEGQSTFEDTWEKTLKRALSESSSKGKTNVAKKIGCEIKLHTSNTDGSHNVELDCRLGDKNGKLLKVGSNVAQV